MNAIPSQSDHHLRRHWVTVSQLAGMTGAPRRTILWACMQGDLQDCHRYEPRPGGAPIVKIDLSHAPEAYRLAWSSRQRGESGAALLELTDRQRCKAAEKAALIEDVSAHLAARRVTQTGQTDAEIISDFLAVRRLTHPGTPSLRTYFRDRERWLSGGKTLLALADRRGIPGKGVKAELDEDCFAFYCSLYLTQEQRTHAHCYRMTRAKARDESWSLPSIKTLHRAIDARIPTAKQIELREGKDARHHQCDPYIPRDWTTLAGNECWVSDHCQFDIIAYDDLPGHEFNKDGSLKPARMWLTTWMDERARFVCSHRIHRGPNAAEVLASFHDAVLAEGIPQNIRIDNGKDYRCHRFAGGRSWRAEVERVQLDETELRPLMMELGITPHFTEVENARAKIVEPWHHHWVHMRFDRSFPGYCGSTPQDRPEQLAGIVKTGGLMKWSELLPLFAQFIQAYHMETHSELGKCPALLRQETLPARRLADPRTLAMLFQDKVQRMVRRNGVELFGCSYGLENPDVIARQGEYVTARWDRMKIGMIYLYEPDGRYICSAINDGLLAANARQEDVAERQRMHRRHRKMQDELMTMLPVLTAVNPVEQIALQHKHARMSVAESGGIPEAPPIPIKPMEWGGNESVLKFRPVSPAPDGSKVARTQENPRMESPGTDVAGKVGLPANILDAYSA